MKKRHLTQSRLLSMGALNVLLLGIYLYKWEF